MDLARVIILGQMYMQMDRGSRDGKVSEWEEEGLVRGSSGDVREEEREGNGEGDGKGDVVEVRPGIEREDREGSGSREGFRKLVGSMLGR